jgi:hypothetical protein
MLLNEFAITPDVFDDEYCNSLDSRDVNFTHLQHRLINDALVRDLHRGEWKKYVLAHMERFKPRLRYLIENLSKNNRFRITEAALPSIPSDDIAWCREAISSHSMDPLTGIVTSDSLFQKFKKQKSVVSSIENLHNVPWWMDKQSQRLHRNIDEYLKQLSRLLSHANFIMFIDPHLDPRKNQYGDFSELLKAANRKECPPIIQLHRTYPKQSKMTMSQWADIFKNAYSELLIKLGLSVDIFIWDKFHNRYLITDIIGIQLTNGFDTDTDPNAYDTWGRLDSDDRDDVMREHDPACNRHKLQYHFTIP